MSKLQRGAICVLIAAAFSGGAVAAPCDEPSLAASAIVPGTPITLRAVMSSQARSLRNESPSGGSETSRTPP